MTSCPSGVSKNRGNCTEGWESFGGSCYWFSDVQSSWYEAAAMCATIDTIGTGAQLASCLSEEEIDFITNTTAASGQTSWLGYRYQ